MSVAMVLWSVTGAVMWWQKRSHRRIGTVVLAAAFGGAIALGLLMHAALGR
jgi:hypothetical protein